MKFKACSNSIKALSIWHAVGVSIGVHLVVIALFPDWSSSTKMISENKTEKVRLEIVKKIKVTPKPIRMPKNIIKRDIKLNQLKTIPRMIKKPTPQMVSVPVSLTHQSNKIKMASANPVKIKPISKQSVKTNIQAIKSPIDANKKIDVSVRTITANKIMQTQPSTSRPKNQSTTSNSLINVAAKPIHMNVAKINTMTSQIPQSKIQGSVVIAKPSNISPIVRKSANIPNEGTAIKVAMLMRTAPANSGHNYSAKVRPKLVNTSASKSVTNFDHSSVVETKRLSASSIRHTVRPVAAKQPVKTNVVGAALKQNSNLLKGVSNSGSYKPKFIDKHESTPAISEASSSSIIKTRKSTSPTINTEVFQIVDQEPVNSKGSKANLMQTSTTHSGQAQLTKIMRRDINNNEPTTAVAINAPSSRIEIRQPQISPFNPTVRTVALQKIAEPTIDNSISDEELKRIWGDFTSTIRSQIARAKNYPSSAREEGLEGKAFLAFKLRKDGRAFDISVVRSSGHAILDKAAEKAIKDASPFPKIPDLLDRKVALLKIPITFILR